MAVSTPSTRRPPSAFHGESRVSQPLLCLLRSSSSPSLPDGSPRKTAGMNAGKYLRTFTDTVTEAAPSSSPSWKRSRKPPALPQSRRVSVSWVSSVPVCGNGPWLGVLYKYGSNYSVEMSCSVSFFFHPEMSPDQTNSVQRLLGLYFQHGRNGTYRSKFSRVSFGVISTTTSGLC